MSDRWLPLGAAVDQAYGAAVSDWLHYNSRGLGHEVALTSQLRWIQMEVTLRPGRTGLAIATIQGRTRANREIYAAEIYSTPYGAFAAARGHNP